MKRILTHSMLRSAEKYPERIAFSQNDVDITYKDLVSKSYSLSNCLLSLGVKKGDRIGICMNRSIESSYSVYGILLSGATYVPIDMSLPENRIIEMITDCEIKHIITKDQFKLKIDKIIKTTSEIHYILGLDNTHESVQGISWSDILSFKDSATDVTISEHDNAYIIYTSGTTGKPKGIVHTHFSGCSYAQLSADLYELTELDILGNHSHLHYDISTLGYLTMPFVGGCTVIIPEAYTIFPVNLAKLIETKKMTIWYSVPLALMQLLQTNSLGSLDYSQLRWVLFGGESFDKTYIEQLFNYTPNASYSNVYGPAEVNQCTYYNFNINQNLKNPIPLGKAWPETTLHIDYNNETENIGELLVSSSTLMKEYWNQKDLTTNSFRIIKDKTGLDKRYYKTGDLVKVLKNYDLEFIGRSDRQIKVRGHRVELNEIENTILSIKGIDQVAVYAKKEQDEMNAIYANIVVLNKSPISESDIKKTITKYLAPQAIPSKISIVESIPRTPAGKVNYKKLIG